MTTTSAIHPTAIISPGAEIGPECEIGPYCIVGPNVKMGSRNRLLSHVVLEGNTTLGSGNTIFQFASVGAIPQDLKYKGEPSILVIGNNNIIREYATLQPGTQGGGMKTVVGSGNLFMVGSHVGHDGMVGDSNVFANYCSLAGHVTVESRVILGGLSAVHQFCRLGEGSILSGGSMVVRDIPPFCTAAGDRAMLHGLNIVGLRRAGLSNAQISQLKLVYKAIFLGSEPFAERLESAKASALGFPAGEKLVNFVSAPTSRGVTMHHKKNSGEEEDGTDIT